MPSRLFPRLILVISFVALATSAHVVSGFSRATLSDVLCGFSRTTLSDVVSGFSRTKVSDAGGSRTSSPANTPDDGVWEAATHVATTTGSSFRVRTEHISVASYARYAAVLAVENAHSSERPSVVRDRSPQHSIPLLI